MPLLQAIYSNIEYAVEYTGVEESGNFIYFLLFALIILALAIIFRWIARDHFSRDGFSSRAQYNRVAKKVGLDQKTSVELYQVAKSYKIDPVSIFTSTKALDNLSTTLLKEIDENKTLNSVTRETEKEKVYQGKQLVVNYQAINVRFDSTEMLAPHSEVSVSKDGKKWHFDHVIKSNQSENFAVSSSKMGVLDNLKVKEPIQIRYLLRGRIEVTFFSKILEITTNREGTVYTVAHSNQFTKTEKRQTSRKECFLHTFIYPTVDTIITEEGVEHLIPDGDLVETGIMLDISTGGCKINTSGNIAANTSVSLVFGISTNGQKLYVAGDILRVNNAEKGLDVSIRFTSVPKRSLNLINQFVHGYSY